MKKLLAMLLAFTMLFCVVGCSSDNGSDDGKDDAPKSTTLVIYSPNSDGEVQNIIPAFEDKYGITVELISDGTGNCLSRIDAEKDNPQCDIFWGGMNYNTYLNYPDLWENYVSPNDAKITVPAYKNYTGFFTSYGLSGNSPFVVNTEKLAEVGLTVDDIKGYQSLVDHMDVLKGKVSTADPVKSSSAWAQLKSMMYAFGEGEDNDYVNRDYTKAWEYVTKFVELIDGAVLDSSSKVYKLVVEGEYYVGVTYEDPAVQLLKDGAKNIAVVYPEEGSNWTPCAASVVKGAPNMDNAKLFIDFLISDEGQEIYSHTTLRVIVDGVVNDGMMSFDEVEKISPIFYEDLEYTAAHQQEWRDEWSKIVETYNATH